MLVKFVYLRNSNIKSWRSSKKRRKKPIWRNLLKAKFTLARTVFQGPETLPTHHRDLQKSCFRSRLKTCQKRGWWLLEARQGRQLGVVTWPAPAQLHWASTGRAPAPRGTQDLPSNTFNPEFSLLRLVQLYSILQNIPHEAILCPSPTGSSGPVPGSFSEPTASLSFLTSQFVSSSHHDPLSLAVLCQKSLAYSLSPGQAALLSFAQRDCNLSQARCQQAGSQSKHIQACQM